MPDYDDTNRGAFFRNKKKTKPNQPDYRGPLNYKGQELELAGWIKTSKSGDSYMSLEVKEKETYQEKTSAPLGDFDKDLPF
jgi:uncharacterized protein (DUF736 family)